MRGCRSGGWCVFESFSEISERAFGGFICFIFKILPASSSPIHIPDIHHVFPFHLLPLPLLQYYPSTLRQQQFSDSPLRHFLTTPHSSLPTAPLLDIIRSARLFTPRAKSIRRQTFSHLFAPPDKPLTSPPKKESHSPPPSALHTNCQNRPPLPFLCPPVRAPLSHPRKHNLFPPRKHKAKKSRLRKIGNGFFLFTLRRHPKVSAKRE